MNKKGIPIIIFILVCSFLACSSSEPDNPILDNFLSEPTKPGQVLMSNQAVDAVGLNTHLNYTNTVYNTRYNDIIKPSLIDLGVMHIRDHLGSTIINNRYADLAHNHDIKLLVINDDNGQNLARNISEIKRLNRMNPEKRVVELIEPANETDYGWDKEWGDICNYLHNFYKTYKTDSETSSIPLLGPSFADTKNSAIIFSKQCHDASSLMDIGNLHAYSGLYPESPYSGGWGISTRKAILNYRSIAANKPIIETENGYKPSMGVDGHPSVSQKTAAKYLPRLILSRLQEGISRVYLYQLINDHDWENFGLLNDDGTRRLQYHSLKNFLSLMNDPGDSFKPDTLLYKIEGNVTNIRRLLFQKRDGTYMLVLWQGVNGSNAGYNDDDYSDIVNDEIELSLQLNENAESIKVYRPSFNILPEGNGIKPIDTQKDTNYIKLNVPDHILVVEIKI